MKEGGQYWTKCNYGVADNRCQIYAYAFVSCAVW
jgi:hypothetical protein